MEKPCPYHLTYREKVRSSAPLGFFTGQNVVRPLHTEDNLPHSKHDLPSPCISVSSRKRVVQMKFVRGATVANLAVVQLFQHQLRDFCGEGAITWLVIGKRFRLRRTEQSPKGFNLNKPHTFLKCDILTRILTLCSLRSDPWTYVVSRFFKMRGIIKHWGAQCGIK
jgi:hypothetical protein